MRQRVSNVKRTPTEASAPRAAEAPAKRRVRGEMSPLRREKLRQAYAEAAADPVFQAEMEEIDRAFDGTVGDGLED
jgi:hypothetical protein